MITSLPQKDIEKALLLKKMLSGNLPQKKLKNLEISVVGENDHVSLANGPSKKNRHFCRQRLGGLFYLYLSDINLQAF